MVPASPNRCTKADEMLVTLGGEVFDHRKVERGDVGKVDPDLVGAVLEHVVKGRTPPVLRRRALVARAVFEDVALIGLLCVPAKAAALEDRVQRIDEDEAARQVQPAGPAALAEPAQQIVFRQAGQTLMDQPVHQAQAGREFHETNMACNDVGGRWCN